MKKFGYILFTFLLVIAFSCQKEVIHPNFDESPTVFLKSGSEGNTNGDSGNSGEESGSDDGTIFTGTPNDTLRGITDPNRDEDDIKKVRKK